MSARAATLLLLASPAVAVFPGAGTLCEAVLDADLCEFVATFDPLHESFILRDADGGALFDPFGLYPEDAAGQEKMQLRELKNARVAMIGFAGLFVNHFMPGAVPGLGGFH